FMFHPDKIKPYDTLRHGPSGYEIGRYGFSANIFMDYLSGLPEFAEMLGTPPDMSKLPLLMKQLGKNHKIPAKFAEHFGDKNFSQEFMQFMGKVESGQGKISKQEIEKFFPKELQESLMTGIAVNAIHKGTDAATLALAFHLGKAVSQLDKEDMADKNNQQYMAASMKVLGLALAKHQSGPNDEIDWKRTDNGKRSSSGAGPRGADDNSSSDLAFSIARAAENNANRVGTVGWCYREVANTLDRFGVHLSGSSAYMAAPQLAANKHFHEVSTDHLKKGTVLVFGPSQGHPHGHITVYLGNGREASDHVQSLVNFNHYGGVRAFEPT
ncbi:MAG: C40 family peptidase, partial [Candidatus Obscuribacterales bacterium]|nr:C40 family peptidase [Candidatus Obscuribacterales bacterium]